MPKLWPGGTPPRRASRGAGCKWEHLPILESFTVWFQPSLGEKTGQEDAGSFCRSLSVPSLDGSSLRAGAVSLVIHPTWGSLALPLSLSLWATADMAPTFMEHRVLERGTDHRQVNARKGKVNVKG